MKAGLEEGHGRLLLADRTTSIFCRLVSFTVKELRTLGLFKIIFKKFQQAHFPLSDPVTAAIPGT